MRSLWIFLLENGAVKLTQRQLSDSKVDSKPGTFKRKTTPPDERRRIASERVILSEPLFSEVH